MNHINQRNHAGNNCLHIALKARSRKLTQCLLSKPNDARLLYRPNKAGETPYSIDQSHEQGPILPSIFGSRHPALFGRQLGVV